MHCSGCPAPPTELATAPNPESVIISLRLAIPGLSILQIPGVREKPVAIPAKRKQTLVNA